MIKQIHHDITVVIRRTLKRDRRYSFIDHLDCVIFLRPFSPENSPTFQKTFKKNVARADSCLASMGFSLTFIASSRYLENS